MLPVAYFISTWLPIAIVGILSYAYPRLSGNSERFKNFGLRVLDGKRKAVLQRRGIHDFVSPFAVWFAVGLFFLSVAFTIYLQLKPLQTLVLIGGVTWMYANTALEVYRSLYAKKSHPHEAHADRLQRIGREVRRSIYGSFVWVAFVWFLYATNLPSLEKWSPFATSLLIVFVTFEANNAFTVLARKPKVDDFGASPA